MMYPMMAGFMPGMFQAGLMGGMASDGAAKQPEGSEEDASQVRPSI
jgi:hypothetical protein